MQVGLQIAPLDLRDKIMEDSSLIYNDIIFDAKPEAVPYNYRISYKVSLLCLIIYICGWGKVSSIIKLQMISSALISRRNLNLLIRFADGDPITPIVRFDPSVNRALAFAVAYGFIEQQMNGNYKLTGRGEQLASQIKYVGDLMVLEIESLTRIAKKLTETKVNYLITEWRNANAEN